MLFNSGPWCAQSVGPSSLLPVKNNYFCTINITAFVVRLQEYFKTFQKLYIPAGVFEMLVKMSHFFKSSSLLINQ